MEPAPHTEDPRARTAGKGAETGRRVSRVEAVLIRGVGILLGLGLVGMVLVNVANAVGRYSRQFSLVGADELLVYSMIWIVMLGAILAARQGDHLSINLLPSYLTGRAALALQVLTDAITAVVCAFVAWHSLDFVERIAALNQTSMGLGMPMVIPHAAIPTGFIGIALVTAMLAVVDGARLVRGERD